MTCSCQSQRRIKICQLTLATERLKSVSRHGKLGLCRSALFVRHVDRKDNVVARSKGIPGDFAIGVDLGFAKACVTRGGQAVSQRGTLVVGGLHSQLKAVTKIDLPICDLADFGRIVQSGDGDRNERSRTEIIAACDRPVGNRNGNGSVCRGRIGRCVFIGQRL